jgi:hypothetical protein
LSKEKAPEKKLSKRIPVEGGGMKHKERFTDSEKARIIEFLISRVTAMQYPAALRYAKEFVRTQSLLSAEEAVIFVAAAHGKKPESVKRDLDSV